MSSDERGRILRMVSEGKLSPTEAEDLLSALEPEPRPAAAALSVSAAPSRPPGPPRPGSHRSLVIQVNDGGESKVNVRVPLALARAAGRFIPRQAQSYLNEYDINIEQLLHDLSTAEGENTLVEVRDGASHVRIAVE